MISYNMRLVTAIERVSIPAPAKINLFLAILGKRCDGFHEILSVACKVAIFDLITLEKSEVLNELSCFCPEDNSLSSSKNLVCSAVREWRKFTGDQTGFRITLNKKIPVMSGLGGGSSDAVATFVALNSFFGKPLNESELIELSGRIGSDCPLFFKKGFIEISGRGEKVNTLNERDIDEWTNKKLFLFKPDISFSTPALYHLLSEKGSYSDLDWAKERLQSWKDRTLSESEFWHNDFKSVILEKYLFMKPLFDELMDKFGLSFQVSGSGSCCFTFLEERMDHKLIQNLIAKRLGTATKFWVTHIL